MVCSLPFIFGVVHFAHQYLAGLESRADDRLVFSLDRAHLAESATESKEEGNGLEKKKEDRKDYDRNKKMDRFGVESGPPRLSLKREDEGLQGKFQWSKDTNGLGMMKLCLEEGLKMLL